MRVWTLLLALMAVSAAVGEHSTGFPFGADKGFQKTPYGEHQVVDMSEEKWAGFDSFDDIADYLVEGDIDPSALSSFKSSNPTLQERLDSRFIHPADTYLSTFPGKMWSQEAENEFNEGEDFLMEQPTDSFQNEEDLGGLSDYYMLKATGDIPTPVPLLFVSLGFQVESMMSQRSANVKRNSLRMMAQIGVKLKAAIFEAEVFVRVNLRLRSQGSRAGLWNTIQTYVNFVIMDKAMSIQSIFFKDTKDTPDRTLANRVQHASDAQKREINQAFLGLGAEPMFPEHVHLGDEEVALATQARLDAEWPEWLDKTVDYVSDKTVKAYDYTVDSAKTAYHHTKKAVKTAYHHTKKAVKTAYHHTKKAVVAVKDWTVARWNDLKAWAKSIRDKIYNFIKKQIQKLINSRVSWIKSKGVDLKVTNTICLGGGAKANWGAGSAAIEAAWCPGYMATMRQSNPQAFSKNGFNGGNFKFELTVANFEIDVQAKVRSFFDAKYKMAKFGDVDAKAWLLKISILFPGSLGARMMNLATLTHLLSNPAVKNIKQKIFGKLVCGEQRMPSQPTSYLKLVKDSLVHIVRSGGALAAARGMIPGFKKRAGVSVSLRFYVSRGKIHWDWETSSMQIKLIGDTGGQSFGMPISVRGQMGISYRTAIVKNRMNPDMGLGCGLTKDNEGFKEGSNGRVGAIKFDNTEGEARNNLPPDQQHPGDGPCHKAIGWCVESGRSRCPSAAGVRSGLCTGGRGRVCCIRQDVMVKAGTSHS